MNEKQYYQISKGTTRKIIEALERADNLLYSPADAKASQAKKNIEAALDQLHRNVKRDWSSDERFD